MSARHRRLVVAVTMALLAAACSSGGDDPTVGVRAERPPSTRGTTASTVAATSSTTAEAMTGPVDDSAAPPTTSAPPPATSAPPPTARPMAPPSSEPAERPPATEPAPPPATADIRIANFTFDPPTLQVAPGTSVTATNADRAVHTWTADDGSWDSGDLAEDDRSTHTFTEAGMFPYHCELHPSMKGVIHVQ